MGGRRCGWVGGLGIMRDLLATARGLDWHPSGARIRTELSVILWAGSAVTSSDIGPSKSLRKSDSHPRMFVFNEAFFCAEEMGWRAGLSVA